MNKSSERGNTNVLCHVTFRENSRIFSTEPHNLLQAIRDKFGLENATIHLQIFDPEWNDWIDVLPEDIPYKSKVKVILHSEPYEARASPSKPLLNKVPIEKSAHEEPSDEVEGAKLPGSPGSSSKKLISFSNVNHPLLTKLRSGKQLDKKETAELVKKVFHIITEHTFFPERSELLSYVKKLLSEFPALKQDNYRKARKYWMISLQNRFALFRNEVLRREKKPKVDATTQTGGIGAVFQDMSPIMLSIKQEFLKPEPDHEKIERLMCLTYQYRRAFIINMVPKVMAIQEMYPALFNCDEVRREFRRITGKENDRMFFGNLEGYAPIIYDFTKGCATRRMIDLCTETAKKKKIPYNWKNAALLLMPHIFKENHNFLWFQNQRFDAEQTEPYIKCNATMKAVAEGDGFFQVYAENILLAESNDFTVAMECFLASFFIFLIEYRSDLKCTLQLLQSFFFEYDDPTEEELQPRVIDAAEMLKDKMRQQNRFVR